MIEKISGRVAYVVMSFGGFLGVGTEEYPVPLAKLTYDTRLGGFHGAVCSPAISAQAPDAARAVVNKIWYSNRTKFLKDGTSLYPRFHADRESPIDHRIKYEGHRPLADDGRLRWFPRS